MASSFVALGDRGFWCSDYLLEIWLFELAETVKGSPGTLPPDYEAHLRSQATAGMRGCIDMCLEGFTRPQLDELRTLAEVTLSRISADRSLLRGQRLNALGLGGGDEFLDATYEDVEALGNVFERLLKGDVLWTAGDKEALPNSWMVNR